MLVKQQYTLHDPIANISLDDSIDSNSSHLECTFSEKVKSERRSITKKQFSTSEDLQQSILAAALNQTPKPLSPASPPLTSSASHIRSRFLNRLGISDLQGLANLAKNSHPTRILNDKNSFRELLKADYGKQDHSLKPKLFSSAIKSVKTSRRNQVSFDPQVRVVSIPSRNCYSNRIRSTIWTPSEEMQHNVARNTLEFAAENWDWRQVADDGDMVYYQGDMVHPVHFMAPEYHHHHMDEQFADVLVSQEGITH
jgi:hypothetical protein